MGKNYRNTNKTSKTPRRPYEKERLMSELKTIGDFGLKNKREVWRVNYTLAKIRAVARSLLTLPEKDPKRIFEGQALLKRLLKMGLLGETETKLDYVLGLSTEKFLQRRLQTIVFNQHMAKSVHHARVLIKQRHIRVGRRLVDIPSFMVRVDSEKHIEFSQTSPLRPGARRPGRVKRKSEKNKKEGGGEEEED